MHVLLAAIFIASSLYACATTPFDDIDVETYSAPDIDYSQYKTFAWAGSTQVLFDPIGQWEQPTLDTDQDVRTAIYRELTSHKLIQDNQNPELLVAYYAGVDASSLGLKVDPDIDLVLPGEIPRAALVVAITDAKTGYVIWLGQAVGNARQQNSIDIIRSRINFAVNEMFSRF